MKKPILAFGLSFFFAGMVFLMTGCKPRKAEYPERDITNVLVWGAGGGTDICNRVVAAEMGNILGVNINVVNKTGGVGGSVGMNYAYSRPHDGYTLCGLSESCVTAGV
ncbi:MAG: tricarboxylate transport protein TctC, partial [Phycisphaerae bacterium SM1_79]